MEERCNHYLKSTTLIRRLFVFLVLIGTSLSVARMIVFWKSVDLFLDVFHLFMILDCLICFLLVVLLISIYIKFRKLRLWRITELESNRRRSFAKPWMFMIMFLYLSLSGAPFISVAFSEINEDILLLISYPSLNVILLGFILVFLYDPMGYVCTAFGDKLSVIQEVRTQRRDLCSLGLHEEVELARAAFIDGKV